MLDKDHVNRNIYIIKKKVNTIIKNETHSIIYGNKTHWSQVTYKDSIYRQSNNIVQGQDNTKYEYFKIQL